MEALDSQVDLLRHTLVVSLGGIETHEEIGPDINQMKEALKRAEYIIADTLKQTLTYINHLGELPAAKARVDLTPQVQWLRQSIEEVMNSIISAHLHLRSALDTATRTSQTTRDAFQQVSECSASASSCHQEALRWEQEAWCSLGYMRCVEGDLEGLPDGVSSGEDEIRTAEQQAEDHRRRRDASQQEVCRARYEIYVTEGQLENFRRDKGVAEAWCILGIVAAPLTCGGSLLVSGLSVGALVWSNRVKSRLKKGLPALLSRESALLQEYSRQAQQASRLEKKCRNLRAAIEGYRDEISHRETRHTYAARLVQSSERLVEDALASLGRVGSILSRVGETETGLRAAEQQVEKIRTSISNEAVEMQTPYDNTLERTAGRSGEFSRRKKMMENAVVALQHAQRDIPAVYSNPCIELLGSDNAGEESQIDVPSVRKMPKVLLYDL